MRETLVTPRDMHTHHSGLHLRRDNYWVSGACGAADATRRFNHRNSAAARWMRRITTLLAGRPVAATVAAST